MAGLLGFGRAVLHEPDGGEDEEEELEVLGLPVLGDIDDEVRRGHELGPGHHHGAVRKLFLIEGDEPRDRLAEEGDDEEGCEEDAERVLADAHPDHRPESPMASM